VTTYVAELRTEERIAKSVMVPREFGGMEPSVSEVYEFEDINLEAGSDQQAVRKARGMARKRNMIVIDVKKIVYQRKRDKFS